MGSILRLLRYVDLPQSPWKNGGGVTREIMSGHDDSADGDFLWRVSIATISTSGPFSVFSGIDRTIAVLSGNGVRLSHPAGTTELTASTMPYAFPGETPVHADVIDGETTDLNAMSMRQRFGHTMEMHLVSDQPTLLGTSAEQSLIVSAGPMTISCGAEDYALRAFDTLAGIPPGSTMKLAAAEPTRYYLIAIQPVA